MTEKTTSTSYVIERDCLPGITNNTGWGMGWQVYSRLSVDSDEYALTLFHRSLYEWKPDYHRFFRLVRVDTTVERTTL